MERLCSLSSTSSTQALRILSSGLIKTTILPVVFMLQLSLMMYSALEGDAGGHIQVKTEQNRKREGYFEERGKQRRKL
ncbi:uncharacterized protein EAE97_003174 [Botrytis byssoidea]|uniref:Uncharacterized protein n=1 Tax=Botrytis byssoidea TaxID=139641 RepID=A0A9P5ITF9_9HELO|nr:uncharacterized protein EAE97_003174 [Botrytis byssoidea]KAF7949665.1 hypothetical protein EAE97_003174 [Botrytis byssoidea]